MTDRLDDVAATLDEQIAERAVSRAFDASTVAQDDLARLLIDTASDARYVAAWHRWLVYESGRWANDATLLMFSRIRAMLRSQLGPGTSTRDRRDLLAAKTVAAIETLARSDRRAAATVDQWDRDLWLLNTPTGTYDLREDRMREHRAEDYLTRATAVAPSNAPPERWLEFLDRVTAGDTALVSYLRRVLGYCLTGETGEHVLFFAYGPGANGKGVFLNTATRILADFATVAPIETFTATQSDRHPTDMAMLRGARLVASQETEQGRAWAESRIKSLTGGDPITARFMRQDFFTYQPQFKLLIAGNHKPRLSAVDEAMRRRLRLIPFDVVIPEADRDPYLPDKLREEWPAILGWMIEGCIDWREGGLRPPDRVMSATAEYFDGEDSIGQWIAECCRTGANEFDSAGFLFSGWCIWAERAGEPRKTKRWLGDELERRGFPRDRTEIQRGYRGLSVRRDTLPESGNWRDV